MKTGLVLRIFLTERWAFPLMFSRKTDYVGWPAGSIDLTTRSVTTFRTMDTCLMKINSCNTNHIPYFSFLILVLTQEQQEWVTGKENVSQISKVVLVVLRVFCSEICQKVAETDI